MYAGPRWEDDWGGHGVWFVVFIVALSLTLPLSAWLMLAWPAGRLTAGERRLAIVITALTVLAQCGSLLLAERIFGYGDPNPLHLATLPSLATALGVAYGNVLPAATLFAVLVVVVRRERRRDPGARRLLRPGVVGLVVGVTVLQMIEWFGYGYLGPWATHDVDPSAGVLNEPTALGHLFNLSDVNRLGLLVVAVGLAIAFRRLDRAVGERMTDSGAVVDVTEANELRGLVPLLAHNLGDPSAGVRFRTRDGAWVDGEGNPVDGVGPGRALTAVAHGAEVIAAVEHDEALRAAPSLVEAAVAATGLLIEHQRLEALARIQLRELSRTRVALVEATDAAMLRLERDLHDGAQQRLVALAFEAGLLDRAGGGGDPGQRHGALLALREGLDDTRRDLLRVASGLAPALLAERGLAEALEAVVYSCPVLLVVDGDIDELVPIEVRAAVWFVVNEAVTNAVKHAGASAITVALRNDRATVSAVVSDDGSGGAHVERGTGLRGLRDRLAPLGGRLDVEPGATGGTVVSAHVPWGATT